MEFEEFLNKMLRFDKHTKIRINDAKMKFVSFMLNKDIAEILLINIYSFLNDNYDNILATNILTNEERDFLINFKKYYKEYMELIK